MHPLILTDLLNRNSYKHNRDGNIMQDILIVLRQRKRPSLSPSPTLRAIIAVVPIANPQPSEYVMLTLILLNQQQQLR